MNPIAMWLKLTIPTNKVKQTIFIIGHSRSPFLLFEFFCLKVPRINVKNVH